MQLPASTVMSRAVLTAIIEPGDVVGHDYVAEFDNPRDALAAIASEDTLDLPDFAVFVGAARKRLELINPRRIEDDINRLGLRVLTPENDPLIWRKLATLHEKQPLALFLLGDASLFEMPSLGVVGSRANTAYGDLCTRTLVHSAAVSRVIISGGALGIDGIAHRAALSIRGKTMAVLAGGLDRFYPAANDALLRAIGNQGALVTEAPPGTAPSKHRFLQRNRLIAALSDAVVVVEAGARSGSMNTAFWCNQTHTPLGAVPGPITSAASAGTHELLKQGARVITEPGDLYGFTA